MKICPTAFATFTALCVSFLSGCFSESEPAVRCDYARTREDRQKYVMRENFITLYAAAGDSLRSIAQEMNIDPVRLQQYNRRVKYNQAYRDTDFALDDKYVSSSYFSLKTQREEPCLVFIPSRADIPLRYEPCDDIVFQSNAATRQRRVMGRTAKAVPVPALADSLNISAADFLRFNPAIERMNLGETRLIPSGTPYFVPSVEDVPPAGAPLPSSAYSAPAQAPAAVSAGTVAAASASAAFAAGAVTASVAAMPSPLYEIVSFRKPTQSNGRYDFAIRITEGTARDFKTLGLVRDAVANQLRDDYVASDTSSVPGNVRVEFLNYEQDGAVISGSAAVMSVSAERLEYDAATQRGRIAVRLGRVNMVEARQWALKNIAALATVKNQYLTADEAPPPGAVYRTLNERTTSDGLLEIEFVAVK